MFGWSKDRFRRRLGELEARVEGLELALAQHRVELLDVVDNVTYRMVERERQRGRKRPQGGAEPALDLEGDHALGYQRRFGREGG